MAQLITGNLLAYNGFIAPTIARRLLLTQYGSAKGLILKLKYIADNTLCSINSFIFERFAEEITPGAGTKSAPSRNSS